MKFNVLEKIISRIAKVLTCAPFPIPSTFRNDKNNGTEKIQMDTKERKRFIPELRWQVYILVKSQPASAIYLQI